KHGIDMLYITQEKLNSNQKDAWHCHLFSSNIYDELQYNKNNYFECDTLVTLGYIFYTKQNKPYTMQNCLKDKKQAIEYMSAALKKASKPNKQSITTFLGDIH